MVVSCSRGMVMPAGLRQVAPAIDGGLPAARLGDLEQLLLREPLAVLEDRARDRWHGDPQPWLDACRAEVARAEAFIRRFERIVAQPEADAA